LRGGRREAGERRRQEEVGDENNKEYSGFYRASRAGLADYSL
jgi:hypothetical protein